MPLWKVIKLGPPHTHTPSARCNRKRGSEGRTDDRLHLQRHWKGVAMCAAGSYGLGDPRSRAERCRRAPAGSDHTTRHRPASRSMTAACTPARWQPGCPAPPSPGRWPTRGRSSACTLRAACWRDGTAGAGRSAVGCRCHAVCATYTVCVLRHAMYSVT